MKKLATLLILALAISCEPSDDLAGKQAQLDTKQKELSTLKEEISKLKAEIAELDTSTVVERTTKVKVEEVEASTFEHYVEITGTVTSEKNIMISAETNGQITDIKVEEGDEVTKGQILAVIDNETERRQLEEAQAVFDLAKTTYEKRKNLWDQSIGSEINYLQAKNNYETAKSRLEQARKRYRNTLVSSPISGTVDVIQINLGEMVAMGTPVIRVVDVDNVEIEAELSENYLASVKKGDSVRVAIPALGYQTMSQVSFVSQVINPNNRSFLIKVGVDNKKRLIKPNILANLMIRDYVKDSAIVVPSRVIGKDLRGDFLFLAVSDESGVERAEKRYVTRGTSFGEKTEILDGLNSADRVITAGYDEVNQNEAISIL
jgi:membrane fusion protein (multidrug efflux system)